MPACGASLPCTSPASLSTTFTMVSFDRKLSSRLFFSSSMVLYSGFKALFNFSGSISMGTPLLPATLIFRSCSSFVTVAEISSSAARACSLVSAFWTFFCACARASLMTPVTYASTVFSLTLTFFSAASVRPPDTPSAAISPSFPVNVLSSWPQ